MRITIISILETRTQGGEKMTKHRNLKSLIIKHNIAAPDLARYLDISDAALSLKLNGRKDFTISEIERLKSLFGLSYEDIFFADPIHETRIKEILSTSREPQNHAASTT